MTLSGASIHSNLGSHDLFTQSYNNAAQRVVQARGNWWGTPDPAAIGSQIYDQRSNGGSPLVDWCGWLDGPGGTVARDVECPDLSICDEVASWNVTARPYLLGLRSDRLPDGYAQRRCRGGGAHGGHQPPSWTF